jgi:S1-C subfamily serine protease
MAGASTFQVQLAGSPTAYPASLVGAYEPDDIAVIRLNSPPPSLKPAQFADSSSAKAGDIVLALGNPLGLTGSVTSGIVSATGRTVTESDEGASPGAAIPDALQTSAEINPGNSGGALVNLSGQVIGMPTLAALDPQLGESAAPGIGFAISSNLVKDIAGQLIADDGHVTDTHCPGRCGLRRGGHRGCGHGLDSCRRGGNHGHIASLMPTRISQALTGQEVKNPAIMPICMRNQ